MGHRRASQVFEGLHSPIEIEALASAQYARPDARLNILDANAASLLSLANLVEL